MQFEVTGLDQDFASLDGGTVLVLRGLSFRDTGYGVRATFGSRSFYSLVDPCNLALKWEEVGHRDTLPKVLVCGTAATSVGVSALMLPYVFGDIAQNWFLLDFNCICCVSYTQGHSVFVFLLLLGLSLPMISS